MKTIPDFSAFQKTYGEGGNGAAQAVWTTLVSDLETPVSAMLKLAQDRPNSFLLESVEGGAIRGRYSFIGLRPDLIWRCFGDRAEINRQAVTDPEAFVPGPAIPAKGAGRTPIGVSVTGPISFANSYSSAWPLPELALVMASVFCLRRIPPPLKRKNRFRTKRALAFPTEPRPPNKNPSQRPLLSVSPPSPFCPKTWKRARTNRHGLMKKPCPRTSLKPSKLQG